MVRRARGGAGGVDAVNDGGGYGGGGGRGGGGCGGYVAGGGYAGNDGGEYVGGGGRGGRCCVIGEKDRSTALFRDARSNMGPADQKVSRTLDGETVVYAMVAPPPLMVAAQKMKTVL